MAQGSASDVPEMVKRESAKQKSIEENNLLDLDISDVPEEYRYMVTNWLDYFQGRGRGHMDRYLSRSSRYVPLMRDILRKNGLPEDLVYIPLIESGYNARARSHAGAVGYWQFIKGTGKRYGLFMNHLVDERQDPLKSTEAASNYLKGLYNLFGSWYLAIASYNVGENRVQRVVMKHYTRSFWELAHRKVLPSETVNYVPKFIAACMIARDPEKYGFRDVEYKKALAFENITHTKSLDLKKFAQELQVDYEEIRDLNPEFRTHLAPIMKEDKITIRIPIGKKDQAYEALAKAETAITTRALASAFGGGKYKVRRGDNLGAIARRFGTSVAALKEVNNIRGTFIRAGMILYLPDAPGSKKQNRKESRDTRDTSGQRKETLKPSAKVEYHKVKKGENLSIIASRYNISVKDLVTFNNLDRRNILYVGKKLRVSALEEKATSKNEVKKHTNAKTLSNRKIASKEKKKPANKIARYHKIKRGENLSIIARKYNVSLPELLKLNKFARQDVLLVGEKIKIP